MNQREMEKALFQMLGAYLDGMPYSELTDEVGIRPMTPTEEARFGKAVEFVSNQIWRRTK